MVALIVLVAEEQHDSGEASTCTAACNRGT
jgi:hypothetical protein